MMKKIDEFKEDLKERFNYLDLKYIFKEYIKNVVRKDNIFPKSAVMLNILKREEINDYKKTIKEVEYEEELDKTLINNLKNIILTIDIDSLDSFYKERIENYRSDILKIKDNYKELKKYFSKKIGGNPLNALYYLDFKEYYKHDMFLYIGNEKPENYEYKLTINPEIEDMYLIINKLIIKFEENNFHKYIISKTLDLSSRDKICFYAKDQDALSKYINFILEFSEENQDLIKKFKRPSLTLPTYNNFLGYIEGKKDRYLIDNATYLVCAIDKYLREKNIKISSLYNNEDEFIENILEKEENKLKIRV